MKILGIKFLNLNSLKGEHQIRFDQAPFDESGIFAITGPTGAGKTTLLDAITVALYGRVHRHSKDVFEIMTRHTAESYAEVEFEVAQHVYRAKWSIRRSRGKADGQLQTQKMELSEVSTGKIIIEHPLQEVRDEIVKVCGLDYNQFLRSVILSQGDFTRFLKADENERSELLEKITDTGIYSQISVAAYEKARDEKSKLEQLRGRLDNVVLLTAEERDIYITRLYNLDQDEMKLKLQETDCRAHLGWLTGLEKLQEKKEQLLSQLLAAELFQAQHTATFKQLQQHRRALLHRPALAELNAIENEQQRIAMDLDQAVQQYPELKKEEMLTKTALSEAKEKTVVQEKALNDFGPVYEAVVRLDMLIGQAETQLERTRTSFNTGVLALSVYEEQKTTLNDKLKRVERRIEALTFWLNQHIADEALSKQVIVFEQIVQQLHELQQRIKAVTQRQRAHSEQRSEAMIVLSAGKATIGSTENTIDEIGSTISRLALAMETLLAGKNSDDLEFELRELPVLINTAEQQLKVARLFHKQQAEHQELTRVQATCQQKNAAVRFNADTLQAASDAAAKMLGDLQQIYELEVKIQHYDEDRLALQPEKPCPLCGAVHHPFVQGNYQARVGETEARRNGQQEKLRLLKADLDQHLLQLNTLQHQLETGNSALLTLGEALVALRNEFDANNSKLPKPLNIDRPEIITAVISRKKELQKKLQQQLQSAKDLAQQLTQAESLLHRHKEILAAEQSKYEQAGLTIHFAEQQLNLIQAELSVAEVESGTLERKGLEILSPFRLAFNLAQSEALVRQMNERNQQFALNLQERSQLQPDLRQNETELRNVLTLIGDKKEANALLEKQMAAEQHVLTQLQQERRNIFGNKDPFSERSKMNSSYEEYRTDTEKLQLLLQQKQEKVRIIEDRQVTLNASLLNSIKLYSEHLQKLTAILSSEGLQSVEALKLLYLPDSEARAAEGLLRESEQKITSAKSLLSSTESDLQTELLKEMDVAAKTELMSRLEQLVQSISLLQQQKGNLKKVLTDDDQLQQRHAEVAQQIGQQQQEFDRFHQLSTLIGSADGKKFSRFAQGLTLARLTELANRHLVRLSDRYLILKSPEKDLDLQIIDGYQADVVRPVTTLSGGESFLVSLALALGLSDLASRKVQINSLFIDEGFGTLDAETLDIAISALENLQASGKSIGIISHVEALKERIGTQIQLSRIPGGTSRIALYSYGTKIEI